MHAQDALCTASVARGLYALQRAPGRAAGVVVLSGAGTRVTAGKLQLAAGACLVLDSSCAEWVFSKVTFQGARRHLGTAYHPFFFVS